MSYPPIYNFNHHQLPSQNLNQSNISQSLYNNNNILNQQYNQQYVQSNSSFIYGLQNTNTSYSTENTNGSSSRITLHSSLNQHFLQSNYNRILIMNNSPNRISTNNSFQDLQKLIENKLKIVQKNQANFEIKHEQLKTNLRQIKNQLFKIVTQQHSFVTQLAKQQTQLQLQQAQLHNQMNLKLDKINNKVDKFNDKVDRLSQIVYERNITSEQSIQRHRAQSMRNKPYTQKSPQHIMSQKLSRRIPGVISNKNLISKNYEEQKSASIIQNKNYYDKTFQINSSRERRQISRQNSNNKIKQQYPTKFAVQQQYKTNFQSNLNIKSIWRNKQNQKQFKRQNFKNLQLTKWNNGKLPKKMSPDYYAKLFKLIKSHNLMQERQLIIYCLIMINVCSRQNALICPQTEIRMVQHIFLDSLIRLDEKSIKLQYTQNQIKNTQITKQSLAKFYRLYGDYCDFYSGFDPVQNQIQKYLNLCLENMSQKSIGVIKTNGFVNQMLDAIGGFYLTGANPISGQLNYILAAKRILFYCAKTFLGSVQASKILDVLNQDTLVISQQNFEHNFRFIEHYKFKIRQIRQGSNNFQF